MRGISFAVEFSGDDILEQLSPGHQIEHQVVKVLLLDTVVKADYVGVLEFSTNPRLPLQFLEVSGGQFFGVDYFGCEFEAGGFLDASSHHRKSALAKLLLELVVICELGGRVESHDEAGVKLPLYVGKFGFSSLLFYSLFTQGSLEGSLKKGIYSIVNYLFFNLKFPSHHQKFSYFSLNFL